tara:strand:+ start:692 stop:874 length:183 start_codon:yes stop_codon:yes gene_type:complete
MFFKNKQRSKIMTIADKVKMLDKEQLENILIDLGEISSIVRVQINKAYRKSLPFGLKGAK